MIENGAPAGGVTLGADKNYDTAAHVAMPHVTRNANGRRSAIHGRAACHSGYVISQRSRKKIEEPVGWTKTVAGFSSVEDVKTERDETS
jgi:hypothetical protein